MDRRDYEDRLAPVPRRRDQVLPALHAAHAVAGWLPEPAIEAVSLHTAVPLSELFGIIASYAELRLAPPHEPHVELCTGLACRLAGVDALRDVAARADVPVEPADCRFLCGVAPVAGVAGRYHGRLTAARFGALLGAAPAEAPA